jgi:hypothetical protein
MIIFSLGLGCSDSNDSGSTSGSGGGDGFGGTEGVDAQLNTLFNLGNTDTTYTGLGDAGVLLHQWDGANRTDPEWIPSPGNSGHSVLAISSSITNAQLRTHDGFTGVYTVHTPYPPAGGLIYPTFPFESKEIQIGCMGAQDIGSDARWNAGCGCRDEPVCDAFFNTNVFSDNSKKSSDEWSGRKCLSKLLRIKLHG